MTVCVFNTEARQLPYNTEAAARQHSKLAAKHVENKYDFLLLPGLVLLNDTVQLRKVNHPKQTHVWTSTPTRPLGPKQ